MGPFEVKPPLARLMSSATQFYPSQAPHIRSAELCATCHTLITDALGPDGRPVGRLPEQVPYLEWRESAYRDGTTCATCHMPEVDGPAPIANLLSEPRPGLLRHEFLGGNFLLPAMLEHLLVPTAATPQDFARYRAAVRALLSQNSARLKLGEVRLVAMAEPGFARRSQNAGRLGNPPRDSMSTDGVLDAEITIENQAGHKLPTAYPSRRAWLHIVVKDGAGQVVFESGAVRGNGSIVGNDNDEDPARFEPHHLVIEKPDQVQIFEAILGDTRNHVTTGLLKAVRYLKDNRVLPVGFDKKSAPDDVAVRGTALADPDFTDGADRVRLHVAVKQGAAPFAVEAEVLYQPIGFRWAENLRAVSGPEPPRFTRAYDALAAVSFQRLASAKATQEMPPPTPAATTPAP
jgi:hypothetical protein